MDIKKDLIKTIEIPLSLELKVIVRRQDVIF